MIENNRTKIKVNEIIKRLKVIYHKRKIVLNYSSPIELLVATILSAQCTDKKVNIVTQELFKKYKTVFDYAKADPKEFEQYIRSTGFYHNKAKNIIKSAQIITEKYNGKVPDSMNLLLSLPGVARKTANIVLGHAFGIIEGIAVDTHVIRLSERLGLTNNKLPEKIEVDLMKIIPKIQWLTFSLLLQMHGRTICKAINPNHNECVLKDLCPSVMHLENKIN